MSELNRRHFLERMTALGSVAVFAPGSLQSRTRPAAVPGVAPTVRPRRGIDILRLPVPEVIQATDPTELTLAEAAVLLRRGELSALELMQGYLDRIDAWDDRYRAFNIVLREQALSRARTAAPGPGSPLAGVPLAIKDNYFTAGIPTTANSYVFQDLVPRFDATAWSRLRGAGAVLLGKTQMGPLATTAATTPDGERTTVNAWAPFDENVSPGGSSSGSATSVAARMAASSTGTQTGGSITNPSNAQGLTGIKPTMGRVSLHGIIPLTYTRDHPGPLARDAVDAAVMLQVMAGPDPADPRSLGLPPVPDYVGAVAPTDRRGQPALSRRIRIGVLSGFLDDPSPPPDTPPEDETPDADRVGSAPPPPDRTRTAYRRQMATIRARREMLRTFETLGAEILEIDLPRDWSTLTSFNFNNVRLPERSEIFLEVLREDVRKFGVSLSPWINGLLLPATEYVRGQRARLMLLRSILDDVFSRCDVVVQTQPFPFDMVGLPLIAFPIGFEHESTGLPRPIGGMFGTEPYAEHRLLGVVAAYQRVTDWHRRHPQDPDVLEPTRPEKGSGARNRFDLFEVMDLGQ